MMYETGRGGVRKDRTQAVSLYRKAYASGNEWAMEQLKRLGEAP